MVRPATRPAWFGHLGLTGAAPTANLLAPAILGCPSNVDLSPYAVERFG